MTGTLNTMSRGAYTDNADLLEVNYNSCYWAGWDERFKGPIDTPDHRERFPGGFMWPCCDKPGDGKGCERTRHTNRKHNTIDLGSKP
jgi:hypothetical protein